MSDVVNQIHDPTTVGSPTPPAKGAGNGNDIINRLYKNIQPFPTLTTLPSFDTTKDYSQFFIALVFCFFISIFIIKILRSIQ